MSDATVFCNQCGQAVNAAASFCTLCGATLSPVRSAAPAVSAPAVSAQLPVGVPIAVRYAGFWIRFLAVFIDALILFAVMTPIRLVLHVPMGVMATRHSDDFTPLMFLPLMGLSVLISIVVDWLYEAYFISSERQATLGKMALGIRVTGLRGERLSFGQATIRHFAKWLSDLTLLVGYIMAAFTERKQALHDMIAGTLVLRG
jgi:uncharacterized RDD family membrane protein YckC